MSIGGLVEIAARNGASLKKLLKANYKTVEDIPYLMSDSWIRSSGFPAICPREEVLCAVDKIPRTWKISADLNLIFQHGHGLHHQLQNDIMPAIDVIRGKWVCFGCGEMHRGAPDKGVRVETWAEARPANCPSCESPEFTFHED
jgi:hypothetical protein